MGRDADNVNKRFDKNDEIDLLDLAMKLIRHWLVLVLALIIGGAGAGAYSTFMITPQYQAECMVYVNNGSISVGSTSVSLQDLDASQSLVDTYMVILKSRKVLMDVADEAGLDYSYEQMKAMVSAGKVNDTEVFSIFVTSADPNEAEKIANTIARVLPDAIADIVEGSSVKIVDYAVVPSQKISPNNTKNAMMGALALFLLAGIILTMRILLDNTIQNDEELFSMTRLPLLSKIPERGDGKVEEDIRNGNELPFESQEAYRLLKTNMIYSLTYKESGKIIGITSSVASEYKTTIAINLANILAQDKNAKVLLLDCDLRMSNIAERLGFDKKTGLTEFLTGDVDIKSIIQQKEDTSNLYIIPGGNMSPNPGELLRSQKMKTCFQGLAGIFDYIIVDFPPANIVSDALELGKECDGMLMVVRQGFTEKPALEESLRKLEFVDINVLGLILTGVDKGGRYKKGYNYDKYYGSYEKSSEKETAETKKTRRKKGRIRKN